MLGSGLGPLQADAENVFMVRVGHALLELICLRRNQQSVYSVERK